MRKAEKLIKSIEVIKFKIIDIRSLHQRNLIDTDKYKSLKEALEYGIKILKTELATCPINEQGMCDGV